MIRQRRQRRAEAFSRRALRRRILSLLLLLSISPLFQSGSPTRFPALSGQFGAISPVVPLYYLPLDFNPYNKAHWTCQGVEGVVPPTRLVIAEWSAAFNFSFFHPVIAIGEVGSSRLTSRDDWIREFSPRKYRLVCFRNYFVTGCSGIFQHGTLYTRSRFAWFDGDWVVGHPHRESLLLNGTYDEVIAQAHQAPANIGHWTFDFAAWLVLWPPHILRRAHFVTYDEVADKFYIREILEIFGMYEKMIVIRKPYCIFARIVYSMEPMPADTQEPTVLWQYHNWLRRRFALCDAIPERHVALKRGVGETRRLENFEEIIAFLKVKTNDALWYEVTGVKSITEAIKFYATVKMLFAVLGAGSVNIVYMQPRTAYLEVQGDRVFLSNWNISRAIGILHVVTRLPQMGHYTETSPETRILNLTVVEKMIGAALAFFNATKPYVGCT